MPDSHTARKAVLLVNSRSLKGREWFDQAKAKLEEREVSLEFSHCYDKATDLIERVKQEIEPGKLIIVGGGDGTLNAAANLLYRTETTLGVLPLGTGNAFARDLGIATDLDKAVEVLISGRETQVDMGVCGDRRFLNVATIGLTVEIAKNLSVPLKRHYGRWAYVIALYGAIRKIKPFQATIETENGKTVIDAVQLVIGNGRYHAGPLPLAPNAYITSGALRLYAVEFTTKAALLRYALILPTGMQGALREVHSERTKGGRITTSPTQSIVVDGEEGVSTPVEFHSEPLSLRVMAPQDFRG